MAERKKYFIKDESLHNTDNDMFNYADISKVLNDIVNTNDPPFNIAIIGKWGLGKSSLINLVTGRCRKNPQEFLVQEINAWKYEKESLRKVFLKQLWQGLSNRKVQSFEIVRREISSILNSEIPTTPHAKDKKRTRTFILTVFGIFLCTFISFLIYKLIQSSIAPTPEDFFWRKLIISYCKNIGTILFIPVIVALLKLLMDDFHEKQAKKIELNFPIETTDDYEIFLETKIKDHIGKNKDLKIITVIDDLDRLSIDKIVEALDALKAFVGFERCIFIVPFDDEIIKQALNKRRAIDFNEKDYIVESELILDKLFQFKIYLPPLLEFDIQKYAFELVKQQIPDFLNSYCDEKTMEKVIGRVLIHPNVSTPRQVKKLLNAFVNNYMIASVREVSGKIEKGLLTSESGTMQIAKISVLQADFNAFYDLLFKDMSCMEKLLAIHRDAQSQDKIPEYLLPFFKIPSDNATKQIRDEYEPLINFLIKTEKYQVPSIAPFLYLAQDDISIQTGDELQRRTVRALISGNTKTVRMILSDAPNVANVIAYKVHSETNEASNVIYAAISVFDIVDDKYKLDLAQRIIERTLELPSNELGLLYSARSRNVLDIMSKGENDNFNTDFLNKYLSILADSELLNLEYFIPALTIIAKNYAELPDASKIYAKEISLLGITSQDISAPLLFPCVKSTSRDVFLDLWGMPWYKNLCNYVDKENDFTQECLDQLSFAFNILKYHRSADQLVSPLLNLIKYAELLPVISHMLDTVVEETQFKAMISTTYATQIAETVIEQNYAKNGEVICNILDGLNYEITEDNNAEFDDFTMRFEGSRIMDKVLIYCGKHSFCSLLPKTMDRVIKSVFEKADDHNLLGKLLPYLPDSTLDAFFKDLATNSTNKSGKDYSLEVSLYQELATYSDCRERTEAIILNSILSQPVSNYSNNAYFDFVVQIMDSLQHLLSISVIDAYIQKLLDIFSNKRSECLIALNRIPGKMSADQFKKVFDKIVKDTGPANFNNSLDVIINNNGLRPTEPADLTAYQNFLISNLPTATNPDHVLSIINSAFSIISNPSEMITNAFSNHNCNMDLLAKTSAKFLDNLVDEKNVAETLFALCKIENISDLLSQIIKGLKKYSAEGVVGEIETLVQEDTATNILLTLKEIAARNIDLHSAHVLLIKCLRMSFVQLNQIDTSVSIMRTLNDNKANLKDIKNALADILRDGFVSTSSDDLKEHILGIVVSFEIRSQFKKSLNGEDLAYYQRWMK